MLALWTFVSLLHLGTSQDLYNSVRHEASAPFFTSRPDTYREKVGETVTLVCQVENLGRSTVIWKQSNRIISAGEVIIRKDNRLKLDGFNLVIRNLKEADAGKYVCEIETFGSPIDQVSSLEILVPPSVNPQPSDGKFVVRKGSTITLECDATGNPKPRITWQRANNLLPSGEKSLEGYSIVIQDVNRHHSGIYVCMADNQVGDPAQAEIDLKVLYPPEIEVDQQWIRNAEGIEAEVSCHVHAEPKAEVKWYKDTMLLDPTNHRHMESYGNRHVLVIRNVKETDFGNYSCMADNSLGRQRGSVEVSGRPHVAKIVSPKIGSYKDQYNLTWTVDSFLPIEEYRILYRENTPLFGGGVKQQPRHIYGKTNEPYTKEEPVEWTNIIPTITDSAPSARYRNSFSYTGSFVFYGLLPTTEYEVLIQSRNKEGWSDASDIFRFKTRDRDYDPLELASHNQQGYFSAASITRNSCLTILFGFVLAALTS